MTSAVQLSCGLYKMLLFAYPSDFRLRFGSEMVTTFSDLRRVGTQRSAGSRSSVAVRTRGSVFCRCATSPTKPNRGYDFAGAAFVVCLVHRGISRNDACVRRQIVNWFRLVKEAVRFCFG